MRSSSQQPGSGRMGRRVAGACCAIAAVALLAAAGASAQGASTLSRPVSTLDQRDARGLTPLIRAAAAGQTAAVRSLLTQGAGVDATAADGRTPLIAAVQNGQADTVRALIAAGANLNWSARSTGTALNIAENKGETAIAAMLQAAGAHSTGKSVGDTVCVRPWGGAGYCGTVQAFTVGSVRLQISRIIGCANGCNAPPDCAAGRTVGGASGLRVGDTVAVPSWCLTQTGVRP